MFFFLFSAANRPATGAPASGSGLSSLGLLGLASGNDMMRDMAMLNMITNNRQPQSAQAGQRSGMDMGGLVAASVLTGADNLFRNMLMAKAFAGPGAGRGGNTGFLGNGMMGTLALTGGLGDSFRRIAGLSMMSRPGMGSNPLGIMAAGSVLDLGFGLGGDNMLGSALMLNSLNKPQPQQGTGGSYPSRNSGNSANSATSAYMPWLFMDGW